MLDCRVRSNPYDVLGAAKQFLGAKALTVGE